MDTLYRLVRDVVILEGLAEKTEEAVDDFDDFDFSSDDSDSEPETVETAGNGGVSEDENSFLYLNLASDLTLVQKWIKKLLNTKNNFPLEEKTHTMGLLAHNIQEAKNLAVIVKEGGDSLGTAIGVQLE